MNTSNEMIEQNNIIWYHGGDVMSNSTRVSICLPTKLLIDLDNLLIKELILRDRMEYKRP
jgi:hypothetical protein